MLKEIENYGQLFGMREQSAGGALTLSDIKFTSSNFDPKDPNKRPIGWNELKVSRVRAKEIASGVDPALLAAGRPKRLQEVILSIISSYEVLMLTLYIHSGGRLDVKRSC
jgi:hypothetical protein